jgi:hypothetical protein
MRRRSRCVCWRGVGTISTSGSGTGSWSNIGTEEGRRDRGGIFGGGRIGVIGLSEAATCRESWPWTWTCKLRCQRCLIPVKSSAERGRERFGEIAIVLFIKGHSCGECWVCYGIASHRTSAWCHIQQSIRMRISNLPVA